MIKINILKKSDFDFLFQIFSLSFLDQNFENFANDIFFNSLII